jgi:hypothetical protein
MRQALAPIDERLDTVMERLDTVMERLDRLTEIATRIARLSVIVSTPLYLSLSPNHLFLLCRITTRKPEVVMQGPLK